MTKSVKRTASHDEKEELNHQQPERSKSKRVCVSDQGKNGVKVEVEASSNQPKKGQKREMTPAQRNRKNANERERRKNEKIEVKELRAMRSQLDILKNGMEELKSECRELNSQPKVTAPEVTALENGLKELRAMRSQLPSELDIVKNGLEELKSERRELNSKPTFTPSEGMDIPWDGGFLEGEENVLQGLEGFPDLDAGTSHTGTWKQSFNNIQAEELKNIRDIIEELRRETQRLNSTVAAMAQDIETLKSNKGTTAPKRRLVSKK